MPLLVERDAIVVETNIMHIKIAVMILDKLILCINVLYQDVCINRILMLNDSALLPNVIDCLHYVNDKDGHVQDEYLDHDFEDLLHICLLQVNSVLHRQQDSGLAIEDYAL